MSNGLTGRLAWFVVGLCILLAALALILYNLNVSSSAVPADYRPKSMNLVMALTFPPFGALIISRKPRHAIGWIFLAMGLGQAVGQAALQYAYYALISLPGSLPFGQVVYLSLDIFWFPSFCFLILLLVLFPDGRPLSRRWGWLVWLTFASIGLYFLSLFIEAITEPQPAYFDPAYEDPFWVGDPIFDLSIFLMLFCLLAGTIALFKRFQRSSGVERQQLKWFAFAGIIFSIVFLTLSILSSWPVLDPPVASIPAYRFALTVMQVLFPIAVAGIPVAVGMSILRYRLYDIDLIIRPTLTYSLLTAALALIYFCGVILLQSVFFQATGQPRSDIATVLSTLSSAALFTPLRYRIQEGIDRRFYRRRYDAEQTLAAFGSSLRDEVDLDTLIERLEAVVEMTLQPESVFIWLKKTKEMTGRQS